VPKRQILDCENYLCRLPKNSRDGEWWRVFVVGETALPVVILTPYRLNPDTDNPDDTQELPLKRISIKLHNTAIELDGRHTQHNVTCCYACAQAIADRAVSDAMSILTEQRAKNAI
jgi:hypothetical protein